MPFAGMSEVVCAGKSGMALKKGAEVEVLAMEEGCIGVWYEATILENLDSHCLIEYTDILTDDFASHLTEEVEFHRVRPRPPTLKTGCFSIGERVEAKDRDGWWMGSVADIVGKNKYKIYFKQLGLAEDYHVSKLRPRRDWINEEWVHDSKDLVEACIAYDTTNKDKGATFPCSNEKAVRHKTTLSYDKSVSHISEKRCRLPKRLRGTILSGQCSSGLAASSQSDKLVNHKVSADLELVKEDQRSLASGGEHENIESNISVGNVVSESFDESLETTIVNLILELQTMIYEITNTDRICGSLVEETKTKPLQVFAYRSVLLALHHEGHLNWEKVDMLANLRRHLNISNETHALIVKNLQLGSFD